MTREEIRKILDNTKVYVNGKSQAIQDKLFSLGYNWLGYKYYKIQFTESPFLFMSDNGEITHSDNMNFFKSQKYREITADEILSIEITESYRPFKTKDECWKEMQKHQPVGWLIGKSSELPIIVQSILYNSIFMRDVQYTYAEAIRMYTFADGTPFGIKEE